MSFHFSPFSLSVLCACEQPVSGGHINPAITVAVATIGHFPWSRVIPYVLAQHLGGFVAAAAIYLTFYDNIQVTQAALNGTEALHKTAHMFTSLPPASQPSLFASFLGSFWGTAVFLFGIAAILDQKSSMKPPKWYWPLSVSFVLMISLAAFGANGGPNVNPAADFPTRIFASCVGWSSILWHDSWWAVIGLLAPHLGAIFALWVYRICISAHYPDEQDDAQDTHELRQLQEKRP